MELEQALNEIGFEIDYKPTKEEVKTRDRELANYFYPDRNKDQWGAANYLMSVLNNSVKCVRDNLDKKGNWNIESYLYQNVISKDVAQFMGYKGEIKLKGEGTVYHVNRELKPTELTFVGIEMNKNRKSDWYIEFVEFCPSESISLFEMELPDFLAKFYQSINKKIPDKLKYQLSNDNKEIEFRPNGEGEIEVSYTFHGRFSRKPYEGFAILEQDDLKLIEKIVLEESNFKKISEQKFLEN